MREHEREARQLALLDRYERALMGDPAAPPPPGLDPGLATVARALARQLGGPPPGRAAAPTRAFRSALRRRLEEQAARYHTTPARDLPPAIGGNGATLGPIGPSPHRASFRPRETMPVASPRREWSAATPMAAARPGRPDAAPPRRRPYRAALATGAGWLGALLVFLAVLLVTTLLLRGLPGTTPAARPPLSPTSQRDGTPTIAATPVPTAPVAPTEPRASATPTGATPVVVPLWQPTGALAAVRAQHSATRLADGRVLVAGGNSNGGAGVAASAELYDPQTGRWSATGALGEARAAHQALLLADGRVLVVGGFNLRRYNNTTTVEGAELYDPATGHWHPTAPLPVGFTPRALALLADGRVLAASGPDSTVGNRTTVALYDPVGDRWTVAGNPDLPDIGAAVALRDGAALLLGEVGQANAGMTPALRYDPATGQLSAVASLPGARAGYSASPLPDGRVLVVGGVSLRQDGATTLDTTALFDPARGTWSVGPALAHARANHSALALADGRVLVLGGEGNGWVAQAELYDPQAGRWAAAGALDPARGHFATTTLADGRALVTGGDAGYVRSVWLADAALFTPPARTAAPGATAPPRPAGWRTGAPLSTARSALTLTPLRDGTVLAVGGDTATGATATTARYDPVADRWVRAGDLAAPRQGHAAVALRDGRVFVVGGGNSATPGLATAAAYDPATDRWAATAPPPRPFARALATVLNDGRVLVVGAPAAGAPPEQALAIRYDPATDRWSVPAKVPAQRVSALLTLPDGRAFLAGNAGQGKPNGRDEPTILLFDPGTAAWQARTPPQATLLGAAAALLPDGTVFVAGGLEPPPDAAGTGAGTPALLARADRYDPVADRWTALAPLPVGRGAAGVVTLTTGQVLVVGGDRAPDNPTGVGYRGRADRYDPAGDRWLAAGTLPGGRDAFAIAALPNGQALVAGGGFVQANSFVRFATVDRYTAPAPGGAQAAPTASPAPGPGRGIVPAPTATRPVPTVPPTPTPGPRGHPVAR